MSHLIVVVSAKGSRRQARLFLLPLPDIGPDWCVVSAPMETWKPLAEMDRPTPFVCARHPSWRRGRQFAFEAADDLNRFCRRGHRFCGKNL
ncbi:hypothetical protein [Methylobacterium aquaticum]|uniref:hypothetical protein n=1 Tax=Methylobacterium aquaticum TaxID=270351 RepID=UPI0012E153F0|nr:hypothetical protein [Methylobacterium aquaticum]